MNIAFAAPVVYPFVKGGVEKRIHEVGRRLADRGHDVTIYSRHWWDGPKTRTHAGMEIRAVGPAGQLYADGDRRSVLSALGLAARLTKPLANADHDLVATPVAPYFHTFTARLSSALRDTPLVITWHEVWDDYWYRYMGRPGAVGKAVEWASGRMPHHPVAPSRTTAEKLREFASRREVEVIPNGIDVDSVASTTPAAEGYDVLFAGRLIEDKNVALLIDAFAQVNTDARLGIIGDGPESDNLVRRAERSPASNRIEFLGFLEEYDDVIAHMRAADVFVSPSVREGFGITLLEAMAANCTVVTVEHEYSAGSEIVDDAGFVVEPTTGAVARALERALSGERPISSPTEKAAEYDWDAVADQTETFYTSLV
ncbi:glycosyltransferase family 4 protein [Salinigranum halophilum]|uniref:glycosyltransferase family 4 protein n=1 Tax=Salinigranum halophilum TaxID=2565931 RepID=UPI0010A87173|nr:glycosyltransferase family 4 protein [Salinigranum halophilum]